MNGLLSGFYIEGEVVVRNEDQVYNLLPAFAECPVQKDGDECEKGTRRSSRLPKNIFGGQVSVGGYASAGFAGAVKMPRAEARGIFTLTWVG